MSSLKFPFIQLSLWNEANAYDGLEAKHFQQQFINFGRYYSSFFFLDITRY